MKDFYRGILLSVTVFLSQIASSQQFADMTATWNINHTFNGTNYGAGATIYDWNNDGLDDLVFCRFNQTPMFLLNNGNGFSQVPSPLPMFGNAKHLTFADYDNDGDPDIFVTVYNAHPRLYRNEGDFYFTEVTLQAGISLTAVLSFGHCWGDYDLDGDLDLYVCNYNGPGFPNPTFTNQFYKNNGNGTFTEAAVSTGISNGSWHTFMATWVDINNDYVPDLFVTNDRYTARNYMYKNIGGGQFVEIAESANLDQYIFSMSATQGDVQNDGFQDFYVTNGTDGNLLLLNNGNETYTEAATEMGVVLNTFNWGSNLTDFDNDTWVDLYVNSSSHIMLPGRNRFFKGIEGQLFMEMSNEAGFNTDENFFNHSSAVGDFNNDGRYDIASTREFPGTSRVFLNTTENNNGYVKVTLEGVTSNRDGIGSWIKVYANGQEYSRYTAAGEGFLSQNSQHIIIGIGEATVVDSMTVVWPGGFTVDTYYDLAINTHYFVQEGFTLYATIASVTGEVGFCSGGAIDLICEQTDVTYLWSTGEDTQVIEANAPGTYTVTIQHASGFTSSAQFTVEEWQIPTYDSGTTNVTCYGSADGTASVMTDPANQLVWGDGSQEPTLEGLPPGDYSFQITSEFGCQTSGTVSISQPDSLVFSFDYQPNQDSPECPLTWSGQTSEALGGTTPYTLSWTFNFLDDQGNVTSTNSITDSDQWECVPGPFNLLVSFTDANGCQVTDSLSFVGLVSVEELPLGYFRFFPNPASDEIYLTTSLSFVGVKWLSTDGKLLAEELFAPARQKSLQLPVEGTQLLFLQVIMENGTLETLKVQVQKD